jgi:hypothetical protein
VLCFSRNETFCKVRVDSSASWFTLGPVDREDKALLGSNLSARRPGVVNPLSCLFLFNFKLPRGASRD